MRLRVHDEKSKAKKGKQKQRNRVRGQACDLQSGDGVKEARTGCS